MLRFISGLPAGGKTYRIIEEIAEKTQNGERPILLVPEQFSFESEKAVLDRLGDAKAQSVSVLSFTRLCDEIERNYGGVCGKTLTDADRSILINRAIKRASGELVRWKNYVYSSGFASSMLDAVAEFKINAVSPDDIAKAAQKTEGTALGSKLSDTACIYSHYNALVSERFIDPSDRISRLYDTLGNHPFFEGKTVFVDSFKSFTGQQLKIVDRIISQAKEVVVSLTDDLCDEREFCIYTNVRKTKQRLLRMASSHGVPVGEPEVLSEPHYISTDMVAVERLMADSGASAEFSNGDVTVCRAETVYDEAEFAARNIRRIVRENGARFKDFVVIARDTAPYEEALAAACKRNGVSCFIDRRIPLASMPLCVAMFAAIEASRSLSTERILRFHKSGLGAFSPEELSELENYTYLWSIDGERWTSDWDMDPSGFVFSGEADKSALDRINELRVRAVSPLIRFKKNFAGTPEKLVTAILDLFKDCNAGKAMAERMRSCRESGENVYADALRQSWDSLMQIFDSLVNCFADTECSVKEFCDALSTAVSLSTEGVIPQMLDEVTFGSADRIRPSRPKYAFILGANQGVFPRAAETSGLFKSAERRLLIDLGIDIPDKAVSTAVDEDFLVYTNVCCPAEKLFISYNKDGSASEPSAFAVQISEVKGCINVFEPDGLNSLPETKESAFSDMCRFMSGAPDDSAAVAAALSQFDGFAGRIESVRSGRTRPQASISKETAERLFGRELRMSPSRFDRFSRCRFLFFCRDGLRVSRLQPAAFDAMQRGTMIHYVLQRVIEEYGKNVSTLSQAEIIDAVERFSNEYLDGIAGYRSVETAYFRFLTDSMKKSLEYIVSRLAAEFAQSDFEPVKCELKLGADGDMPEWKIPIKDGGNVLVSGTIDRLDRWNGYIRIVDYKTGQRKFRLPDVLMGQNMQMLIYLYAASKSENFGGEPAGIFYMPAKRVKKGTAADRRMSGMMVADEALVTAMEKENKGEFVPRLSAGNMGYFVSPGDFEKIFDYIDFKLSSAGYAVLHGDISADPVDSVDTSACIGCDFAAICRIEDCKHQKARKLTNAEVLSEMEKEVGGNEV